MMTWPYVLGAPRLLSPLTAESPPHFKFYKRRVGGKHAVIVINGFMSKGNLDVSDWEKEILRTFGRATWYHLDWEAARHPSDHLAHLISIDGLLENAFGKILPNMLTAWHSTMVAAAHAGKLLAQAIVQTPEWRYTLIGHSLGARVIHFALKDLAQQPRKHIENAYLLGGAVGGGAKDDACWEAAVGAVKGKIFNCYSGNDEVLRRLYQGANAMLSKPIGYSKIHLIHPRITSIDATLQVHGHTRWKEHFGSILNQLAHEDRQRRSAQEN
jgi:hypothetical protein